MMRYAINVGLHVEGGDNTMEAVNARAQVIHLAIGGFISHRGSFSEPVIKPSSTEPTLIVHGWLSTITFGQLAEFLYSVAVAFNQDCIAAAVLNDSGCVIDGTLVGPRADKWGHFDANYFVL